MDVHYSQTIIVHATDLHILKRARGGKGTKAMHNTMAGSVRAENGMEEKSKGDRASRS